MTLDTTAPPDLENTVKFSDILRGYAPLSKERYDHVWANAHFCLDTNHLLDVYRYSEESRQGFLALLRAMKPRLFIPHRVATEFARERATVILKEVEPQAKVGKVLADALKELEAGFPKHPYKGDLAAILETAKASLDEKFGKRREAQLGLLRRDTILEQLLEAVGDVTGEEIDAGRLNEEYERRKAGLIPPYCKTDDKKEEEDKRKGDLAVWLEILDHFAGKGTPVIFVTDDKKENWWEKRDGRRYIRTELAREAFDRIGAEVLFYDSEQFDPLAAKQLGVEVPRGMQQETKAIRERQESPLRQFVGTMLKHWAGESLGPGVFRIPSGPQSDAPAPVNEGLQRWLARFGSDSANESPDLAASEVVAQGRESLREEPEAESSWMPPEQGRSTDSEGPLMA